MAYLLFIKVYLVNLIWKCSFLLPEAGSRRAQAKTPLVWRMVNGNKKKEAEGF
jgi:hypothetical protein